MLNMIWGIMMLIAVIAAFFSGNINEIGTAAMDGAAESITFLIGITGVMCFWSGLMNIAEKSGAISLLSRLFSPLLHFLFPHLLHDEPAMEAIVENIGANLLGIGNAATPAGLRAMRELDRKNGFSAYAPRIQYIALFIGCIAGTRQADFCFSVFKTIYCGKC